MNAIEPAPRRRPRPRRRTSRAPLTGLAALLLVALAGAGPGAPADLRDVSRGRVVLAGERAEGALERFLARGEGAHALWIEWCAPGAEPRRAGARGLSRGGGSDRDLAAAIEDAGAIVLSGGRFADWFEALTPGRHPSRVARALEDALRRGADLAALGPAAGFVAGATLVPSDERIRRVRDRREEGRARVVVGLALERHWFVDVGGGAGTESLRLADALLDLGADEGLWLAPEGAVAVGPDGDVLVLAGPVAVLSFERAQRNRDSVRGARLWLLATGDRWEKERGAPRFAEGVLPRGSRSPDRGEAPGAGGPAPGPLRSADDRAILFALAGFAASTGDGLVVETPAGTLALELDRRARRLAGPGGARLEAARIDFAGLRR